MWHRIRVARHAKALVYRNYEPVNHSLFLSIRRGAERKQLQRCFAPRLASVLKRMVFNDGNRETHDSFERSGKPAIIRDDVKCDGRCVGVERKGFALLNFDINPRNQVGDDHVSSFACAMAPKHEESALNEQLLREGDGSDRRVDLDARFADANEAAISFPKGRFAGWIDAL